MLLFKKAGRHRADPCRHRPDDVQRIVRDLTSKEPQQLTIQEGHARNYTEDSRSCELALVDSSDADKDDMIVVPKAKLRPGETIRDPKLPFDIQVIAFFENSEIRRLSRETRISPPKGPGWPRSRWKRSRSAEPR